VNRDEQLISALQQAQFPTSTASFTYSWAGRFLERPIGTTSGHLRSKTGHFKAGFQQLVTFPM
jgi:hypothetical protein